MMTETLGMAQFDHRYATAIRYFDLDSVDALLRFTPNMLSASTTGFTRRNMSSVVLPLISSVKGSAVMGSETRRKALLNRQNPRKDQYQASGVHWPKTLPMRKNRETRQRYCS
jgi:hypothetical protein